MPKRTDLQSILILGSGPIVIGQAAEFDYSEPPRNVASGTHALATRSRAPRAAHEICFLDEWERSEKALRQILWEVTYAHVTQDAIRSDDCHSAGVRNQASVRTSSAYG